MDHSSITLREFIEARLDEQDRIASQILAEVRATNGRVRTLEAKVAVLEDRMPAGAKRDVALGGVGAFVAGLGWFLWEKFSK